MAERHNHTRFRNDDGPWSACPETCPAAEAERALREQVRQCLDDAVLMHTGRSVGDIASGRVTEDLFAGPLAPLLGWRP